MNRLPRVHYNVAVIFLLFTIQPCILLAKPTVEANTISWPDDGWYQVQRADTFESICEGSRSCTVEPGDYIVINHTTGERFQPVRVDDIDPPDVTKVEVRGNVIYWPDDGWYQVQRSDDYSTVCEGERSCTVTPGSYTVINHTLNIRYKNIKVMDDEDDDDIIVVDTVIEWSGDGWFQVQSEDDYRTVCEGRINLCETGYGTFQLINFTTGERWDDIEVKDQSDPNSDKPMVKLRGVVYTEHQIELFWERLDDKYRVTAYRIWRDGNELDVRDALSFYESDLEPGRKYLYEVAPLRGDVEVGPRVSIELSTPSSADDINVDNAEEILRFIASVINEEQVQPYTQLINTITRYDFRDTTNSTNDGFEYIDSKYIPENQSPEYVEHQYRCVANDGSMLVGRSLSIQQYTGEVELTQCQTSLADNRIVRGSASYGWTLVKYAFNPGGSSNIGFDELAFVNDDDTTHTLNASLSDFGGALSTRQWQGGQGNMEHDFLSQSFEGATTIDFEELFRSSGATKEKDAPPWARRLRANFTVQSPQTGNRPLVITTDVEFATLLNDSCFDTGVLTATGTDNSWLKVDAGNADPDSFVLTVHSSGSTITQTVQWSKEIMFKQLAGSDSAPASTTSACAGFYLPNQ